MCCMSVIFSMGAWNYGFRMVNPGPRAVYNAAELCFNINAIDVSKHNIDVGKHWFNGLHGNRDELAIAATNFDLVACAETKVTGRGNVSEFLLMGFKAPTLLLSGARPNRLGMAFLVRFGLSVSRQERFECSCCEFMVAKIPGQLLNNCYLFVV